MEFKRDFKKGRCRNVFKSVRYDFNKLTKKYPNFIVTSTKISKHLLYDKDLF